MALFQTQAVLRRASRARPLVLVGITLDSTFYPDTPADALGPLTLTKGLVALGPLTAVDAAHPADAAEIAKVDARESWSGLDGGGPDRATLS